MIDAAIISSLVQTLCENVMQISPSNAEIRLYFLLNFIASWCFQSAMSFVILKCFSRNEVVITKSLNCELVELEVTVTFLG